MNRSTSIKYKAASSAPSNPSKKDRSLNTYDHATDNDIFALGDAAEDAGVNFSQFDIPDDIFKDFGFSLEEELRKQMGKSINGAGKEGSTFSYTVKREGSEETGEAHGLGEGLPGIPEDHDKTEAGEVQVSTITKTLPDGRTVHTRIMRGPIKTKRRLIKINRELPSGETELLGTYEAENAQEDIGKTVQFATDKLVPSLVMSESESESETKRITPIAEVEEINEEHPQSTTENRRMSMDGDYDNAPLLPRNLPHLPKPRIFPSSQIRKPSHQFAPSDVQKFPVPEHRDSVSTIDSTVQPGSFPTTDQDFRQGSTSPVSSFSEEGTRPLHLSISSPPGSVSPIPPDSPASIRSGKTSRSTSLPANSYHKPGEEDVLEFYPNGPDLNIIQEISLGEGETSLCPRWCPNWCWKTRRKKGKLLGEEKGKLGMTQSEINTDEKELPGLQGLVVNYARMLVEDKAEFLETLFRAVKLNKLDVVKILCKIIQKSGLKLASRELREAESSATVLHVALLYNHNDIVDFLLATKESGLIMAKYENDQYRNQTALHVAVANGFPEMVEKLLLNLDMHQKQVLVNTIADGSYFKNQHPYGQLCLTGAAWAGHGEIIKILVHYGGNLALKSHNGNTLLHTIVLQSAQYPKRLDYENLMNDVWEATGIWADQMSYAARNIQQRQLEQKQMQINLFKELFAIRNNDGDTPLALATKKNSQLFGYMLNFEKIYKIPQNKLGSIAWVTYDVTDLTSFAYDTYNKFSVLHILAHNSQRLTRHDQGNVDSSGEKVEDFLDMEPIKALLACKWSVYRMIYIAWLFIHTAYMIFFTAATAQQNSKPDVPEYVKVYHEFGLFLILPIIYFILEFLDLFGNRPYRVSFMKGQHFIIRGLKCVHSEWTITGNGPYRLVNIGFSIFVMDWYFLYITRSPNQDIALAMALLLGWVFVLFFTRGCRVTSRFSIMIQKMFFRDLIYFLTVYGIILIGFSFAMNALFTYKQHSALYGNTISKVFNDMMNVVTDLDRKQSTNDARHKLFAQLLLIFYAIVAVILLMNMLIAMMNTSYETVRVTRCNLWKQQQLSIMLMLERRFFWWRWLCRKSEGDIWRKDSGAEIHSYLDVTVLHTTNYSAKNR